MQPKKKKEVGIEYFQDPKYKAFIDKTDAVEELNNIVKLKSELKWVLRTKSYKQATKDSVKELLAILDGKMERLKEKVKDGTESPKVKRNSDRPCQRHTPKETLPRPTQLVNWLE